MTEQLNTMYHLYTVGCYQNKTETVYSTQIIDDNTMDKNNRNTVCQSDIECRYGMYVGMVCMSAVNSDCGI